MSESKKLILLHKNLGFTLIELLVVLVIIGVMVTLVSLNIAARPSPAKQEAYRLQSLLELAHDEAILKGQILAWKITPTAYAFYRYKDKQWQLLTADKILRSYSLQSELSYKLELDNAKIDYTKESQPQIMLLPDGLINDFSLFVQLQNQFETYKVYSEQGKIKTLLIAEIK